MSGREYNFIHFVLQRFDANAAAAGNHFPIWESQTTEIWTIDIAIFASEFRTNVHL